MMVGSSEKDYSKWLTDRLVHYFVRYHVAYIRKEVTTGSDFKRVLVWVWRFTKFGWTKIGGFHGHLRALILS